MHNLCRIRDKAGNMLKKTVGGKTTKYFFDTQLRAISDYLIKHNIDGIESIMGVQNLVVGAFDYAFGAEFMKQSNSLANQAVYDWFDVHRDKWERITDLGDFRRWRVKE